MTAAADAREARDHPALEWPARLGMLAYGVVYVLVGWLAGHLAVGDPEGQPSGQGALHQIAQQPLGAAALWLAAAGLAALAVWEACQAVGGHRSDDGLRRWGARAGSAGRGVVFGVLAVLAAMTAAGDPGGGGGGGITADLMSMPLGPVLVVGVGVAIAAVGVYSAYKGLSDRWRKDLEVDGQTGAVGGVVTGVARAGYVTRGAAFVVVGGLFGWAGLTHDARKSGGLDQAIVRFRDEAYGPWLMLVVAVGLGCYGVYHLFRAWYLRGS